MSDRVLDRFFHPKSIAVIGASESIYSYGTRYIQALLDFGYKDVAQRLDKINRLRDSG